jgi:PAS domain S-box-containing protein
MHTDPPHASPDPFRLAVDLSPIGLVVTDADGRMVLVNRAIERLFGYTRDELIGRPVELLVPERFRSVHPRHRARYAAHPGERAMGAGRDLFARRKDGSEFPVEIGLEPVVHEGVQFVVGSVVDITERRRLEATLRQAQRLDAVGRLAGGIAHDFNNVLAAIMGYAAVARDASADRPQVAEDLDQVLLAAERGRALVQGILAFSRPREPRRQTVDVERAVDEVQRLVRPALAAGVRLAVRVLPDTPRISADPTALQQVILNLATNAGHAMEDGGGVLELEAAPAHVDGTLTRMHPELRQGLHARITVRDQGVGMTPEVLAHVFEPFFTTRAHGTGAGLGMAMVQGIVHEHGGAIGIQSAPGKGTTVHVYLPSAGDDPVAVTASTGSAPRGRGECILLVDDEADLSRIWARLLEDMGYRVECTASGVEALEALRRRPSVFDVVLTDLAMPGMTGMVLAAETQRLRPGLPVILASGYPDDLPADELKRAGVRAVLRKPYSTEEIGRALRAALDGK